MLERDYQQYLVKKIPNEVLPGGLVVINDPNYMQGIPDLTVFFGPKWALLEVKASEKSKLRPNQQYWIDYWSQFTFCSFIYPENEAEVLNALQAALQP